MRLVTVSARGQTRVGVEAGEWIIDLNRGGDALGTPARRRTPLPQSMNEFLAGGEDAMAAAREVAGGLEGRLGDPREAARLQRDGVLWAAGEGRRRPPGPARSTRSPATRSSTTSRSGTSSGAPRSG